MKDSESKEKTRLPRGGDGAQTRATLLKMKITPEIGEHTRDKDAGSKNGLPHLLMLVSHSSMVFQIVIWISVSGMRCTTPGEGPVSIGGGIAVLPLGFLVRLFS